MTVGPHTRPRTCSAGEEARSRQVQSLAQGHTVPKGQSRTYAWSSQPWSPPCTPQANSWVRRAGKAAQATPAPFLLPPGMSLLSSWDPPCAHSMARSPASLPAVGSLPSRGEAQLLVTGAKETRPNLGTKKMRDLTVLCLPVPSISKAGLSHKGDCPAL